MKKSRKTQARTEIVQILRESKEALTHLDIQERLNGLCDRVTIYRVLDRLLEEGLIHKIVGMNNVTSYAHCHQCETEHEHSHDHIHFSCEKCHTTTCLDQVKPQFDLPEAYQVSQVNFSISGLCPQCI